MRPKGLGRGLDALLASGDDETPAKDALQTIALDRLRPGKYQPRTRMDDASLAELADSIREQGVMQPILVRPIEGARFEIIAGERRWRAAQRAGLSEVPVLVKAVPDHAALALSLIENIQREDLNPLEEATGLQRLIAEFGLTHDAAAKAVGRSRSAVTNLLRLTQLAKPVQEYLLGSEIEMGHARALLSLPIAQQTPTAARVVARKLSVRETERLVAQLSDPSRTRKTPRPGLDADTLRLENELAERIGANVKIEPGRKGSGRIVIRYSSLEQLDGILARIR
ncbi:MAG TPA: ParB/RepB/Spo0J family partition protein [Casimicrobiaceae bacterium]|nr:ParB/RepB/Spo0J family partition protein [Casimicrobiaceae bacterium]